MLRTAYKRSMTVMRDKQVLLIVQAAIYILDVLVTGALALGILPAVLTRHPAHGMAPAQTLLAVNDVRTALVAFPVAAGAAGTLWFTGHGYGSTGKGM
jgi:hypothetical protein